MDSTASVFCGVMIAGAALYWFSRRRAMQYGGAPVCRKLNKSLKAAFQKEEIKMVILVRNDLGMVLQKGSVFVG